jgi:isopenicillin N synthase-like dioxygenase
MVSPPGDDTFIVADFCTGFIKSTVHRVVTPPKDQIQISRLGLLYFSRPGANTPMRTVLSPLLGRLGLIPEEHKDHRKPVPTGTEYVRARVKDVHHKTVLDKREGTSFEFRGLKVQNHYE